MASAPQQAAAAAHQVSHFMAGIYPLCSFLHVPGKMSRPAWLSLGTAFLVEPPTPQLDERTRGMALLTAAHTVLPWAYLDAKASRELKLPEEFRKSRYVVGRVYLPDAEGNAQRGAWYPVKLSALHPTLDVGLLSMGAPSAVPATTAAGSGNSGNGKVVRPSSLALSEESLVEADRFRTALRERHLLRRFRLSSRNLSMPNARADDGGASPIISDAADAEALRRLSEEIGGASASVASIVGFRAKGLLGTMNTMDPRALDALEPSVRAKLMAEMADIEGRQEAATVGLKALEGGQRRFFVMAGDDASSITASSALLLPSHHTVPLPKALAADESLPLIVAPSSSEEASSSSNGNGSTAAESRSAAALRCASIGLVSQGYGYHGMSGSPIIVGKWSTAAPPPPLEESEGSAASSSSTSSFSSAPSEWCCGVLHGASQDPNSLVGTIPDASAAGRVTPVGAVSASSSGSPTVAEMVAASSSSTPFVSYIPSEAVLDWCIRDLSGVRDEAEVRRIRLAHDPLRALVVKEEILLRQIKQKQQQAGGAGEAAPSSPAAPSAFSAEDPVTDAMMTPDDEDLAFIAKIRQEKLDREAKRRGVAPSSS